MNSPKGDAAGRPSASVHAVRVRFAPENPFWVMSASKDVIDNHNGIWLPAFQDWVRRLLTNHVD
jgi:hypothetical protein